MHDRLTYDIVSRTSFSIGGGYRIQLEEKSGNFIKGFIIEPTGDIFDDFTLGKEFYSLVRPLRDETFGKLGLSVLENYTEYLQTFVDYLYTLIPEVGFLFRLKPKTDFIVETGDGYAIGSGNHRLLFKIAADNYQRIKINIHDADRPDDRALDHCVFSLNKGEGIIVGLDSATAKAFGIEDCSIEAYRTALKRVSYFLDIDKMCSVISCPKLSWVETEELETPIENTTKEMRELKELLKEVISANHELVIALDRLTKKVKQTEIQPTL